MQLRVDVSADGKVLATLVENELQVGCLQQHSDTSGKILRHIACFIDTDNLML